MPYFTGGNDGSYKLAPILPLHRNGRIGVSEMRSGRAYWKNSVMSGAVAAEPGRSDTPRPFIMRRRMLSC